MFTAVTLLASAGLRGYGAELYRNDPSKDSGPALVQYGLAARPIPAGQYYVHKDLVVPAGIGFKLRGAGMPDQSRGDAAWKGRPVTTVHDASGDGTLLTVRCSLASFEDIGLVGCVKWKNRTPPGKGTLLAFQQVHWKETSGKTIKSPPVGTIRFRNFALLDADYGVVFMPGDHGDHVRGDLTTNDVNYPYVLNENQAVDHNVDLSLRGDGKYCVWVKDGGRSEFRITTTGSWDRWLAIGDPNQKTAPTFNNGRIVMDVTMDGGDRVGRPLEELYTNNHGLIVRMTGYAAHTATIVDDPIVLDQHAKVSVHIERSLGADYVWEGK